jgi:hypothetical protein
MFRPALALVAISLLCLLPTAAEATLPGPNGPIVYVSGPGFGDAPLVIRTVSGSTTGPLATGLNQQHRHPAWSPDRTKIVFAEGPGGATGYDIYILDLKAPSPTAQNPQNLTNSTNVTDDRPAWSPDGTRIAYESGNDIIVHPLGGGPDVNMTSTLTPKAFKAAWSPDSQTLYYSVGPTDQLPNGSNNDIKIFQQPANNSSAGTELIHISNVHALKPAISPDGTKLCYGTSTAMGSSQSTTQTVRAAPLSAPNSFTIVRNSGLGDYNCTWSPDGTKVAYAENFGNNAELFARNANGTGTPDNLSNTPGKFDGNPDWAPNPPPSCENRTAEVPFNGFASVQLSCTDTPDPPSFTESDPDPEVVSGPSHGVLGGIADDGSVIYTPNVNFSGTDTFTYKGNDGTSDSPPATVTLNVAAKPPAGGAPAKAKLGGCKSSRVSRKRRFKCRVRATPGLRGRAVFRSVKRVRVSRRRGSRKRKVTLARKSFTVPASGRVTLRVRLSKRSFKILVLNRKIRTRATVTLRNAAGRKSTARKTITLRAPRRH